MRATDKEERLKDLLFTLRFHGGACASLLAADSRLYPNYPVRSGRADKIRRDLRSLKERGLVYALGYSGQEIVWYPV